MPAILSSLYQQYKADGARLDNWLGNAAVNCGFALSKFIPSSSPLDPDDIITRRTPEEERRAMKKKKAKAKAKARKQGLGGVDEADVSTDGAGTEGSAECIVEKGEEKEKETPAMIQKEEKERPDRQYTISSKEYIDAAEHLAKQAVKIPVEFMRLLRRYIDQRLRVSNLYNPGPDTTGHISFIEVLKKVESILAPHCPGDSSEKDLGTFDPELVGNRFAALPVEETAEDLPDIALPDPPRLQGTPVTHPIDFAKSRDIEDAVTSVLLFISDIHAARKYIKELWTDYNAGRIELCTASVTTNTAISLLRRSHDSIIRTAYPRMGGHLYAVIRILVDLIKGKHGEVNIKKIPIFSKAINDHPARDIFEYLFIPHMIILVGIKCDITEEGLYPLVSPGYYGDFDPARCGSDDNKTPYQERWTHNQILLQETFGQYINFLGLRRAWIDKGTTFFLDEMAAEMEVMVETRIPTLLLFACSQIFIDINSIVGTNAIKGYEQLRRSARHMSSMLHKRIETEPRLKPRSWPAQNEDAATSVRHEAELWSGHDILTTFHQLVAPNIDAKEQYHTNLFGRSPFLCGLLLFRLRLRYQEIGFYLVNNWSSVLSVAHLYAAVRHLDDAPGVPRLPAWPEMDTIMELHGETDIFAGKIPTTIDESIITLLKMWNVSPDMVDMVTRLVSGVSPSRTQGEKLIRGETGFADARAKRLQDRTRILPIYKSQSVDTQLRDEVRIIDISQVEQLLVDMLKHSQAETPAGRKSSRKTFRLRRQRKHKSPKFSNTQLLSVLEAGLETETPSIRFDYVAMHLKCLEILRKVKDATEGYLRGKYGIFYGQGEDETHVIVQYVLMDAAMPAEPYFPWSSNGGRSGGSEPNKALVGARKAMRDCLG